MIITIISQIVPTRRMYRPSKHLRFLLPLFALLSAGAQAEPREMPTITLLADNSLSLPVTQLAVQYSRTNNVSVSTVFQPPSAHQKTIEDGEPADLLITADATLIERLSRKGLTDVKSPKVVATDQLVLATFPDDDTDVLPGNALTAKTMPEFEGRTWVILNPETFIEGKAAMQLLEDVKKGDELTNLTFSPSVQDAISSLREHGRIGIIPSAHLERGKLRKLGSLEEERSEVSYTGLVVASENMEKARAMLAYLSSDEAKAILREAGLN